MESQQEPKTWREYLDKLASSPQEMQRLAQTIGTEPVTLVRWKTGITKRPREDHIQALLRVLPTPQALTMRRLLSLEFPHLGRIQVFAQTNRQEVSPRLYAKLLSIWAQTPQPLCTQKMQQVLFAHIIEEFDPTYQGLSLCVLGCVPPRSGEPVRSFRELGIVGTRPFSTERPLVFRGAESLIGHVVTNFQSGALNSREEVSFFPAAWEENQMSMAAFVISRQALIAGGLVVASAHEQFFTTERLTLLEHYAHLATLLFEPQDFYELAQLKPGMLPAAKDQVPLLQHFHHRVTRLLLEKQTATESITLTQAMILVWQELEETLLQLPLSREV
jgi:hypothetical protein